MSAASDLLDLSAESIALARRAGWRLVFEVPLALIAFGPPVVLGAAALLFLAAQLDRDRYVSVPSGHLTFEVASRLTIVVAGAILAGGFVGTAAALVDRPDRPARDALGRAAARLHLLALYYLGPVAALVMVLDVDQSGLTALAESREGRVAIEIARRAVAFVLFLVLARFVGLAPVTIVRGEGLLAALRASRAASRGHGALLLATTLVPCFLVLGGVLSVASVDAFGRAGVSGVGASAAGALMLGGFALAPFVAGVLKVAAMAIATRPPESS